MQNPLRSLPSVNEMLENPQLKTLIQRASHNAVVSGVRKVLDDVRQQVADSPVELNVPDVGDLASQISDWITAQETPKLRPVINATGVVLHTGLGRAPLAEAAIESMSAVARGYASVEIDLKSGNRSQRVEAVERNLCELTGAEAAAIVNNNAAATLLTLTALGFDQEVVVSRGELVEIGGSFRLPDVMESAGVRLNEVGTTNKTRIGDYEKAINEQTAGLMRVHTSNYEVVGFTESVTLPELVKLGQKHSLPVIDDVGSGALFDFSKFGLVDEPVVVESVRAGADVVLFSGDKMVGGPQCGIIVGKKSVIKKIVSHPMMRAMRVDKITLAALATTLQILRDPAAAEQQHPLLMLLSTPIENLKLRAERIATQLELLSNVESAVAAENRATLGGGSVPSQEMPTWCVEIRPSQISLEKLSQLLRTGEPAIMGRIQDDRLLLDLKTVPPRHDVDLIEAVRSILEPETE